MATSKRIKKEFVPNREDNDESSSSAYPANTVSTGNPQVRSDAQSNSVPHAPNTNTGWCAANDENRCITSREAAVMIGVSNKTLMNWRSTKAGNGLTPVKLPGVNGHVFYRYKDVLEYIKTNRVKQG